MNAFLSGGHVEESEAALRAHAKFKGRSDDDSELALSSLYLTQNRLTANFHVRPSSIEYADVTAFWTDGAFARLHVDHIQTMR